MKRVLFHPFFIRLSHWEYWNSTLVYLPIYPYWLWLSIKARSFYFLTAANPSIKNGGLVMESKAEVYKLLPEGSYPTTILCSPGAAAIDIAFNMSEAGLTFPLIAKPDHGERGLAVKKLHNMQDVEAYARQIKVDWLLQEYVRYENEVGIFYCRPPGTGKGMITGIVAKQPVSVKGDGRSTVRELVFTNKRFILQWKEIQTVHSALLDTVPAKDEEVMLIPYGNHARGSEFTNVTDRLTPALEAFFCDFCSAIEGFFFGRLDIRFDSWELLEQGKAFSVIELNGSGSEPTHIYDPKHSIFYAWREIIRHWDILYAISVANIKMGVPTLTLKQGRAEQRTFRMIAESLKNIR